MRHAERDALAIAHVDCDAFYAAVEKRDDPSLRDKPVIVGGGARGVVLTCCYIARTFGVRSAMPMFQALKACPQATIVRPDMAKYARVGREVRARMHALTPLVQPLSIDEAFLDLSGTQALHGASPALTLARFAAEVERDIGITVSIGLSYCKFLAKLASDLEKPRGFTMIGRAEAVEFLADKPVGLIWGVGRVAQERLARDGYRTIGDLQRAGERALRERLGAEGGRLFALANGIDARAVAVERETKSISAETTLGRDAGDAATLAPVLYALCEKVADRLKREPCAARGVTLKLKTADFQLRTRARGGLAPTQLASRLFEPARALLARELDGTLYRLIGIGVSDFAPAEDADRGDLVDVGVAREKAASTAIDALRAKFGRDAIERGITFAKAPRTRRSDPTG